jgi:hypothetical protein
MSGWEVLSDLIKIGVPTLFTGLMAFFIARGTRSHELDKERRRRKQDCLERVIEDFDELQSATTDFILNSYTVETFGKDPNDLVREHVFTDASKSMKQVEAAQRKFCRSRSKLSVFGFEECAAALTQFDLAVAHVIVALQPLREGEERAEKAFDTLRREMVIRGLAFQTTVAAALKAL